MAEFQPKNNTNFKNLLTEHGAGATVNFLMGAQIFSRVGGIFINSHIASDFAINSVYKATNYQTIFYCVSTLVHVRYFIF